MKTGDEYKTKGSVLRTVPERWKAQYCRPSGKWNHSHRGDNEVVYERLVECLNNGGTAEDVDAIIGNSTWTTLSCDLCHSNVERLACFGEPYESYSEVCSSCLETMLKELNAAT